MIYLRASLSNPWAKGDWDEITCKSKLLSKNKAIDINIDFDNQMIVELSLNIAHRQDHAGFRFTIGLFRYSLSIQFYDIRHWDSRTNTWEVYDENIKQDN